jgi:hypothetical protein
MSTPTLGEIRPIHATLKNLSTKADAAAALLWLATDPAMGEVTPVRLELVIEMLREIAADLGGIVETMRGGAK